jgi:hypothetical protein
MRDIAMLRLRVILADQLLRKNVAQLFACLRGDIDLGKAGKAALQRWKARRALRHLSANLQASETLNLSEPAAAAAA